MTKTRLLPETDLAEIAALPRERRRKRLESIKFIRPPYSYNPSRFCLPDILNQVLPLFGPQPATAWEHIERRIHGARSEAEIAANLGVSKPLYNFVAGGAFSARTLNMSRMALGSGISVQFWSTTGLIIDGRLVIPFMDFRRTGLTPGGRQIVFSLMKEHIETRYPDYAEARLAIFKFTDADVRKLVIHYSDGIDLMAFDELQIRIQETYELWCEVLEDRVAETRRAGGSGSLL